jgi:hypothetical protein
MKSPITFGIRSAEGERLTHHSTFGDKEKRTLGVEEDRVVLEVWPLEHTPQFRYVLLSVRGHYAGPLRVSTPRFHPPFPPTHTLLVIADEYHLP